MRGLFLLVLLSVASSWLGIGTSTRLSFAHASSSTSTSTTSTTSTSTSTSTTPVYRVRRRTSESEYEYEYESAREEREQERALNDLLPSFSKEDQDIAMARMPDLELLLTGVEESALGEKAYDVMQTAMNDYLTKQLKPYFSSRYELLGVSTRVTGGSRRFRRRLLRRRRRRRRLAEDASGLPTSTVAVETSLFFPSSSGSSYGEQMAMSARVAPSSLGLPTNIELQLAAGEAWNNLAVFRNYLMVAAAVDGSKTFDTLDSVEAVRDYPTSLVEAQEEDEIVLNEPKNSLVPPGTGTDKGDDKKDKDKDKDDDKKDKDNDKKDKDDDKKDKPDKGLSVSAVNSQQFSKKSGTDRINPLWPALIVGMAVFLITTIVLGYRRQRATGNLDDGSASFSDDGSSIWRGFGGTSKRSRNRKKQANILVHVDDGHEGVIEVEDQAFAPSPTRTRTSTSRKKKGPGERREEQRNLDKQYATSCLGSAAADALSPTHYCNRDYHQDEYEYDDAKDKDKDKDSRRKQKKSKSSCLPSRRKGKNADTADDYGIPLQRQDSMALDRKNHNHNHHHQRGIDLPREVDLTNDRSLNSGRRRYSQSHNHNHNHNHNESWRNPARLDHPDDGEPSSDMTPEERDTFVRYMQAGMTLEEASSRVLSERNAPQRSSRRSGYIGERDNNSYRPKAMVVSGASSCASSYHDSEFARAIEETAMA